MCLQAVFLEKSFLTYFTNMMLLSYIYPKMLLKVKFLGKFHVEYFRNIRFSPVWVQRCFFSFAFSENPLYVSGDVPLGYLSGKIPCCIFHKHKAFPQYVLGDVYWGDSFGKILLCIFHKHEALYLHASRNDHSYCLSLKILHYKLYLHQTFYRYLSKDGYPGNHSLKILCLILCKHVFHQYVPEDNMVLYS